MRPVNNSSARRPAGEGIPEGPLRESRETPSRRAPSRTASRLGGAHQTPSHPHKETVVTATPLPAPRTGPVVPDRFAGRTALVTGASRGIGLGIAGRLLAEGASVVITARGQEGLDEAVAELGAPDRVLAVAGKSDDEDHQREVIARAEEKFGPIDLLVNNTGINPVFGRTVDIDLAAARKITEVNALGTLSWTQKIYHAGLGERGG